MGLLKYGPALFVQKNCHANWTLRPAELSTHLPVSTDDDYCSNKRADFCTPHIVLHTALTLPSVTVLLHTTHRTAHCANTALCNSSSAPPPHRHSCTHCIQRSGPLHVPTALSPGKEAPRTTWIGLWLCPQAGLYAGKVSPCTGNFPWLH